MMHLDKLGISLNQAQRKCFFHLVSDLEETYIFTCLSEYSAHLYSVLYLMRRFLSAAVAPVLTSSSGGACQ
jgi:hypothetical protein